MAYTNAPHAGKVKVREVSTGHVIERWPVDARTVVSQSDGAWVYHRDGDVAGPTPTATADTHTPSAATPSVDPAARLAEKSNKELKALAKHVGIAGGLDREGLITALVPHVHGGTVSLDDVKGLPHVPTSQFPQIEAPDA